MNRRDLFKRFAAISLAPLLKLSPASQVAPVNQYASALACIKSTAPSYLRAATDMTIRQRMIAKMLVESGRVITK